MRLGAVAAIAFTVAALISTAVHAGTVEPLAAITNADGRLGLCDVLPGAAPSGTSWATLAHDAGARTNRWEFRWDRIEAKPGVWDFSKDDPAVASSASAGIGVEGILIGTPAW